MEALHERQDLRPAGVGPLLRRWREARHLSQLELALEAGVSARHISFLETGKASPSRQMLLSLSGVLDVPLRERNVLLQAAGFAAVYRETGLDNPRMGQIKSALEIILAQQANSAVAFDRYWNLVMVNAPFVGLLELCLGHPPEGLAPLTLVTEPRWNLMHLLFDPKGVRQFIVNWEQVAKALLNQAYRTADWARDEAMQKLLDDLFAYPGVPARWREPDLDAPQSVLIAYEMTIRGKTGRFFSTVTTLGKPQDVTLQELQIEAFHPADAETAAMDFSPS
jgi:transcriptional regulator with XRE-family HTH domain